MIMNHPLFDPWYALLYIYYKFLIICACRVRSSKLTHTRMRKLPWEGRTAATEKKKN